MDTWCIALRPSDPVYSLAVELVEPDHWVAYILDLPGCFSSAKTEEAAVGKSRERIREYFEWLATHGEDVVVPDLIEIKVDEHYVPPDRQLRETSIGDIYIVNAFFRHDARPLTKEDLQESTRVLSYQREDLLALLDSQVAPEDEKLLLHVGSAEWWYWDRMDLAFPREDLPDEWRARLSVTRAFTLDNLPSLLELSDTKEKMGETWSARKLLRRVIWHERDHMSQIATP